MSRVKVKTKLIPDQIEEKSLIHSIFSNILITYFAAEIFRFENIYICDLIKLFVGDERDMSIINHVEYIET